MVFSVTRLRIERDQALAVGGCFQVADQYELFNMNMLEAAAAMAALCTRTHDVQLSTNAAVAREADPEH